MLKLQPSKLVSLAILLLGPLGGLAAPIHAPYAPYAVELTPSSTWLAPGTPSIGFNGSTTGIEGFGHANYMPGDPSCPLPGDPSNFSCSKRTESLQLTFTADPGSVFTGLNMYFDQWSYAWNAGSGISVNLQWSIPGATWAGTPSSNSPTPTCNNYGLGNWWNGSGSSGCFQMTEGWVAQGGGGFPYWPLMGPGAMPVLLNNVGSFTMNVDVTIWAGGTGFFGDGMTSGFGFSRLDITAFTAPGTPAPVSTPEPTSIALLIAGLGLIAVQRRKPD